MRHGSMRLGRIVRMSVYLAALMGLSLYTGTVDQGRAQNAYQVEYQFKASSWQT